jgi:hypothetical protein
LTYSDETVHRNMFEEMTRMSPEAIVTELRQRIQRVLNEFDNAEGRELHRSNCVYVGKSSGMGKDDFRNLNSRLEKHRASNLRSGEHIVMVLLSGFDTKNVRRLLRRYGIDGNVFSLLMARQLTKQASHEHLVDSHNTILIPVDS